MRHESLFLLADTKFGTRLTLCYNLTNLDILTCLARKGILWLVVGTILPPCVMNEISFSCTGELCWDNHSFTSKYQFILYGQFISCTKVCVDVHRGLLFVIKPANRRECFFFRSRNVSSVAVASLIADSRSLEIGRNLAMLI